MDVFRVGELAWRTDYPSEELEWRWDPIRRRQMIDELGRNPRILEVLFDEFRVFLVDRLHRSGCLRSGAECRRTNQHGHDDGNTCEAQIASHGAMVFLSPPPLARDSREATAGPP